MFMLKLTSPEKEITLIHVVKVFIEEKLYLSDAYLNPLRSVSFTLGGIGSGTRSKGLLV
jgi:hypothetical protein